MNSRNKILFTVMVLMWSLNWTVMKIGLNNAPTFMFSYQRYLLAFLSLLIMFFLFKSKFPRDLNVIKRLVVYGLVSAIGFTLTTIGLASQSSGVGAVLNYTYPIWVLILAILFLSEHLSATRFFGTVLGFMGLTILFINELGSVMSFSALILVAGALLWSVGVVYYKLKLQEVDAITSNLIYASFASLIAFPLSILFDPPFTSWSWSYLATIVYCGIGSTGIGMTLWVVLLRKENTTSLSSSSMLVPMIALFLGWFFLSEQVGLETFVGSVLVILGTYLVNKRA